MVILQLLVVVYLSVDTTALGNNADIVCHQCFDVASPEDCQEYVTCGKDEMCFTREFTNHAGKRGYHLGCESTRTCRILQNAAILFGKRSVQTVDSVDAPRGRSSREAHRCYRCCNGNLCNQNVCNTTVSNSGSGGCPPTFVKSRSKCYYVANWNVTWDEARLDCQRRGADLVSINTAEEQLFIQNSTRPGLDFWTGGYYAPATRGWEWLDGTNVDYTAWYPSYPRDKTNEYEYRIAVRSRTKYNWFESIKTASHSFICEMGHI
ncbi:type-2 ice-structuring protein-like [Haliotis asinina]|uniref:type-2 ice-structuring protein-like n=1 Tax=Haliotis asinina TaxID=109174 RepID=UPI003531FE97